MKLIGLLLALSIAGLLACGGGGGRAASADATFALVYADPPGSGYRFVRDTELSTATHLVLDLVGPAGDRGRGVAFTLALAPGPLAWARVAPGDPQYAQNILFDPGTGVPFLKTAIQEQTTLLADDFQKGAGNDKPMAGPICRVALDSQGPLTAAATVPLSVVQFRLLPATGSALTDATANCAVGTVTVQ